MISIKTIEKDDDRGLQFRIVKCFRDCVHSYVSYFQSLESACDKDMTEDIALGLYLDLVGL